MPSDEPLTTDLSHETTDVQDWASKLATTVDTVVCALRDKSTKPVLLAVKSLFYVIIITTLLTVVIVIGSIAIIRVLDAYAFPGKVWASDALLGAIMTLIGAFAWSKRKSVGRQSERSR